MASWRVKYAFFEQQSISHHSQWSHGYFQVVPGGGQAKFPLVLMVPHVQSFSQKVEYVINGCQFFTFEASPDPNKSLVTAWDLSCLEPLHAMASVTDRDCLQQVTYALGHLCCLPDMLGMPS